MLEDRKENHGFLCEYMSKQTERSGKLHIKVIMKAKSWEGVGLEGGFQRDLKFSISYNKNLSHISC